MILKSLINIKILNGNFFFLHILVIKVEMFSKHYNKESIFSRSLSSYKT